MGRVVGEQVGMVEGWEGDGAHRESRQLRMMPIGAAKFLSCVSEGKGKGKGVSGCDVAAWLRLGWLEAAAAAWLWAWRTVAVVYLSSIETRRPPTESSETIAHTWLV